MYAAMERSTIGIDENWTDSSGMVVQCPFHSFYSSDLQVDLAKGGFPISDFCRARDS